MTSNVVADVLSSDLLPNIAIGCWVVSVVAMGGHGLLEVLRNRGSMASRGWLRLIQAAAWTGISLVLNVLLALLDAGYCEHCVGKYIPSWWLVLWLLVYSVLCLYIAWRFVHIPLPEAE